MSTKRRINERNIFELRYEPSIFGYETFRVRIIGSTKRLVTNSLIIIVREMPK